MSDSLAMAEFMELTAAQKAALTKAAKRKATGFRVGDRVRTTCPRSPRFHNRVGTVATTNMGEVGVSFTSGGGVDAWFIPAELHREVAK